MRFGSRGAGWGLIGGILPALLLTLTIAPALASTLEIMGEATFSAADMRITPWEDFSRIDCPGYVSDAPTGYPALPHRSLNYLLPEGYRVESVEILEVEREELHGSYRILPGLAASWEEEGIHPSPAIYQQTEEYPGRVLDLAQQGFWRGNRVANIVYRPVGYQPATSALVIYPRVEFRLHLVPDPGVRGITQLRSRGEMGRQYAERVRAHVENAPAALDVGEGLDGGGATLFAPSDFPSLDGSLVEYVIITDDNMATDFQELADWRTKSGLPGVVRTISWIEANYPEGVDRAQRIRRFIQDAYEKWGTNYVLLAGDTDIIPVRQAHCQHYELPEGVDIAAELYYAALDGSWDGDGDGIFGEGYDALTLSPGDSVDLYADIFVGRAPVETPAEAQIFIDKTLHYEQSPDMSYQNSALFVAEVVFPNDWDPGDPIWFNGCDIAQSAGSYVPASWDTLYLCEYPHGNENHTSVYNALNDGYHLVTIVSHGDAFKISTSDYRFITVDEVLSLTNTDQLSVYYYSNCQTSQMEAECINEAFMLNPNGGAVACIAPTRLDFPSVAQHYHDEFYRMFFQTDIYRVGELSEYHKIPFIGTTGVDGQNRWTHLVLSLIGDPALPLYKDEPGIMSLAHTGSFTLGDSSYTVTVTSGLAVVDAEVVLWKEDTGEYARARTNSSGLATLKFRPETLGNASLTVTKPGYLPKEENVNIVAGVPLVYVSNVVVDDDSTGSSLGNGDGRFDAGEKVELGVTLTNGSGSTATAVTGALSLASGSTLSVDCLMNWTRHPDRLFLGAGGVSPAADLPVDLPLYGDYVDTLGDIISTWGRPHFNPYAPSDSGCYVWEDDSGWHVRLVGGGEEIDFFASFDTDGSFLAAEGYGLEAGDGLSVSPGTVSLVVSVDSTEFEDGVNLVPADSTWITIHDGLESYGNITHSSSVTRYFVVEAASSAPDLGPVPFDLTIDSGALAAPISWPEGVIVDISAPELTDHFHTIDDASGGNGNGVWEVGETVNLRSYCLNRGSGTAEDVTAIFRPLIGITATDSIATFDEVPGGLVEEALDDFVLTSTFALMTAEIEFTDNRGRSWTDSIELEAPTAPDSVRDIAGPLPEEVAIDVSWAPVDVDDIYGYNIYRSSVSGSGHTLLNGEVIEYSSYYRDTDVTSDSTYYYYVRAVDSYGNMSPPSAELAARVRPRYQGAFPQTTQNTIWASPMLMDLGEDADGDLEVMVGSKDGKVYCWDADGNIMPGWPRSTGGEIWASPAVGQLDGDAQLELIIGSNDTKLYAFNYDGSGLLQPSGEFADLPGAIRSTPTLSDLDGDGDLEVVVGTMNGFIYTFHHDGTGYFIPSGEFANKGGSFAASPTVADLDGNGDLEIIAPNGNNNVYVWNHDGTGFLSPDGSFAYAAGAAFWASAAVGDIDNNGTQDIVVSGRDGKVHVWNRFGSTLVGWPQTTSNEIWGSPALGDIAGDARLEVAVGGYDRNVYVFNYQGTLLSGWPQATGDSIWASTTLADITGDGTAEVIVGSTNGLVYAWEASGNRVPGWPQRVGGRVFNSGASVADLDQDGDVEVVVGTYDGRIYAWDLASPWDPSPSASPWPMFCHDTYRTGWFDAYLTDVDGDAGATHQLPAAFDLAQNRPNPFNPITEINYQLAAPGAVTLVVYDVEGRVVRELVRKEQPAGYYRMIWDGRDERGITVSSGIYFYRLDTPAGSWARKMVMVK